MEAERHPPSPRGGPDDVPGVPLPPPLIYIIGFAAGIGLELLWPTGSIPGLLAATVIVLGILLWLYFDIGSMMLFRRAGTNVVPFKPTTALVTTGVYRVTRNPIYLGMAILYASLALGFGLVWSLAILPIVIVVVDRLVIAREEAYLARKFGRQYEEFRSRVRRWI